MRSCAFSSSENNLDSLDILTTSTRCHCDEIHYSSGLINIMNLLQLPPIGSRLSHFLGYRDHFSFWNRGLLWP